MKRGLEISRKRTSVGFKHRETAGQKLCLWYLCPVVLVFLSFLLTGVVSAEGVVEDEKGIYLGIKFNGSSLHTDTDEGNFYIKDDGGGIALDLGYRFNRIFSLELSVNGSNHDTSNQSISSSIASLQLLGYYRFSKDNAFRPYIKGGLGGYSLLMEEGDISSRIEGGGVAIGGGFRFFFTPRFGLGVDITHSIIEYDEAQLNIGDFSVGMNIDEEGSQTTLGISFIYGF